ncbi:MAG: ABC transporter substrate-binding protein [Lachnospiraceae bacterium]|nr:ABC transporter substrate-binding protein [Lachnospiraceae bacterium]MDN4742223.1 ABC transporter substrate-binding protein [Lachnospiraceae bacterium C1.1]
MKRKLVTIILSATMAVSLLAGCGSSAASSGSTAADAGSDAGSAAASEAGTSAASAESGTEAGGDEAWKDQDITLKVLWGQSTTDAGAEDMIDEALAEVYPNLHIEWECVDWGEGFGPKMQQYMQSGLPDVMIGKGQDVKTYASLGILDDLTDLDAVDKVLDDATKGVTVDDKVYGIVYNALYQGVFYNRQVFKDLGLEVPKTQEDLQHVIDVCNEKGITPFASHMVDSWSIGNVTMQFAINDIFAKNPSWGDDFRAGKEKFSGNEDWKNVYNYNKLIYDNTFEDTFSLEQTACDAKLVNGEAAMKVSGAWSIQNFLDIDENFDFGIFPFPNQTGDAKLIFEPNITFMKSKDTAYSEAADAFINFMAENKDLAVSIYDFTSTASMLKDVTPTFNNPSQTDIDTYASAGEIIDANSGNTQLVWSGFQDENANDIAEWLLGNETIDEALEAADSRVDVSAP